MGRAGKLPVTFTSAKPFDYFIERFLFFLHFCKRTFTMFYLSVNYLQRSLRIELQTDVFDPLRLDRFRCILFFFRCILFVFFRCIFHWCASRNRFTLILIYADWLHADELAERDGWSAVFLRS